MEQWLNNEIQRRRTLLEQNSSMYDEVLKFVNGTKPTSKRLTEIRINALILETIRRDEKNKENIKDIKKALKETLDEELVLVYKNAKVK